MLHLGVTWGLRALSPLWEDIWSVNDNQGVARPLTPCAAGETSDDCQQYVRKLILLITDGETGLGSFSSERVGMDQAAFSLLGALGALPTWPDDGRRNPSFGNNASGWCSWLATGRWNVRGKYKETIDAANDADASTFNTAVGGAFTGARLTRLLDAFDDVMLAKSGGGNARSTAQTTAWTNVLDGLTPWQLFHSGVKTSGGATTDIVDQLMDSSNAFGFDGRPQHGGMACRMWSPFTAYGRVGDAVQVGGRPVEGVAPFAYQSGWPTTPRALTNGAHVDNILEDWTTQACRIAGERGVQIRAIFIGASGATGIQKLRDCLTAANQPTNHMHITSDAAQLRNAFSTIFSVSRNIRFLN